MNTTNIAGEIEETSEVVDQGESREVDVHVRPSNDPLPDMHHLFDDKYPYFAKLWVGDGLTFHDDFSKDSDTEWAGASNAYTGETSLAAAGAGASGASEVMFAIQVSYGHVEISETVSVPVDGCNAAVTGIGFNSGFTALDYVVEGVTSGSQKQQAMDQLMQEINKCITPTVVLAVPMQFNSVAVSENTFAITSTIAIGGVGVFTIHSLADEIKNDLP